MLTIPCTQPYEAAQHDPSPAYWETTVIAPSGPLGPDDILVDGMPVGNVFSFVWNLLVSMSFQFVGASIGICDISRGDASLYSEQS